MKFGILTINKEIDCPNNIIRKKRYFEFTCICGNIKSASLDNLRSGRVKSCGDSIHWERKKERDINTYHKKHGMSKNKIYYVYTDILTRCNNVKATGYKDYGGRGIKCEWESFDDFYKDMGEGYEKHLQIDRIDVNGNYCKENCRWVTRADNCRNKRNTIHIGKICLAEYCRLHNLKYSTEFYRIKQGRSLLV